MSRVVPLHYVEAALLSVISTTGGPEGQPLGAKRLTVDKVIDISDFLLDMGFHYSGSAEDTLHRLNIQPPQTPSGRAYGPLLGPCRS